MFQRKKEFYRTEKSSHKQEKNNITYLSISETGKTKKNEQKNGRIS